MDEFNMAISLNPASQKAHLRLADTYLEDNQLELANCSYEKALVRMRTS
jgi:Tfp pilus assembly protein PilF